MKEDRGPLPRLLASRAALSDARALEAFLDEHPKDAPFGLLLYNGGEVTPLTRRILAVPLRSMLGLG